MTIKTMEIDPKEIVLLEENARYMTHEEFNRLVDTARWATFFCAVFVP